MQDDREIFNPHKPSDHLFCKHWSGVISAILAIIALIIFNISFSHHGNANVFLWPLYFLISVVGLLFGVIGLFKKDERKFLAIFGTVINSIPVLFIGGLLIHR